MNTKLSLVLLIPALAFAQSIGPVAEPPQRNWPNCPLSTLSLATPTTLPAAELVAAVEEERLAHDVYITAAERWGWRVFTRVAASEVQHEATLSQLAATAGVVLPAARPGMYATAELQELHASVMALVNHSAIAALQAAALVEETDLSDLRRLGGLATDEPTRAILAHLERASAQHLSAFVRNLAAAGIACAPQVLAAADYAALLARSGHPGAAGAGIGRQDGQCDGSGPGLARGAASGSDRGGRRGGS